MKRQSVRNAYRNIRPSDEAKERMLQNILLSSEIPSAGKDERIVRKKMKPLVIAAIIAAMIMLMGCAVVVITMQDLKLGERTSKGEILDSEGNVLVERELVQHVLSLHGMINSPTYLAHQEWFEFYEEYSENHEITEEENFFVPPEEYQAYPVYNQELMDKVDEIAEKYSLKLLGACAYFQRWESDIFYLATGVESYLTPDSVATTENQSGYFYQEGNFKVEFDLLMPDGKQYWNHPVYGSIYYSKADNFDTIPFYINDPNNIEQWNYITEAGNELLILYSEFGKYALVFCVNADSMIYIRFDTHYENADGKITHMTKHQIEQIAEQFDYSLKVESVDMDLAKEKLGQFKSINHSEDSGMELDGNIGYSAFIQARIDQLHDDGSEEYYCLTDIDNDGSDELIVGSTQQIEFVWTMKYGQMNRIMKYGENYNKLEEDWLNMEKKLITEYPVKSALQDKYGYGDYIDDLLSMEHPENSLYVLSDINNDGTLELLIGDKQHLSFVWRVKYNKVGNKSIELLSWSMTEEELNDLKATWLTMERKPVTEYYSE